MISQLCIFDVPLPTMCLCNTDCLDNYHLAGYHSVYASLLLSSCMLGDTFECLQRYAWSHGHRGAHRVSDKSLR